VNRVEPKFAANFNVFCIPYMYYSSFVILSAAEKVPFYKGVVVGGQEKSAIFLFLEYLASITVL